MTRCGLVRVVLGQESKLIWLVASMEHQKERDARHSTKKKLPCLKLG